jgi:hypothetical protein
VELSWRPDHVQRSIQHEGFGIEQVEQGGKPLAESRTGVGKDIAYQRVLARIEGVLVAAREALRTERRTIDAVVSVGVWLTRTGDEGGAIGMWPSSAAMPRLPRCSRPSRTSPQPMPRWVSSTTAKLSALMPCEYRSWMASALASFSSTTGTPTILESWAAIGNSSH